MPVPHRVKLLFFQQPAIHTTFCRRNEFLP